MKIFIGLVPWFLAFTLKGFSTLKILDVIFLLSILVFPFPLNAYFESTEREIVLVFPKIEEVVTHDGDMFKLTVENYSYWKLMMEDHL